MAIAHTIEEDDGVAGGEDLHLEVVVPEDVQAVMNAAEDGDAQALSTALGHSLSSTATSWFNLSDPAHSVPTT